MATTEELLARLRVDLDDPQLPGTGGTPDEDSLWSDAELFQYIDEAQKEFAQRTFALPDASTYTTAVTALNAWVLLDENIVEIRDGFLTTASTFITPVTLEDINTLAGESDYGLVSTKQWRNDTGTPRHVITDWEAGKGRLYPTPVASDTIEWSVYRLPATIEDDSTDPEIESQYHYKLLTYAKMRAYMKQDAEVFDPNKARDYEMAWEQILAEADSRQKIKRRTVRNVKYGGY